MRKSTIFFIVCLAFIFGLASYSFLWPKSAASRPLYLYISALCLAMTAIIIYIWHRDKKWLTILLGGSFFILGIWRYALVVPTINQNHIAYYYNQSLFLRGIIDDEPDPREGNVRYTVNELRVASLELLRGKVLIITKSFPEYQYGDEVEFKCQLAKPEVIDDFDYPAYLERYEIYSLCYYPEIKLVAHDKGSRLISSLYRLKDKFVVSVNRILPEPQSSFLGGILYGAKRGIPADLKDAFKKTGTAHLVALSGYNISIIAAFITATLSWFWIPRRLVFPLAVLLIIGFVLLTGAQASVVRAGIMGLIVLLAKNIGRLSKTRNILVFSAAVMLLQNPKILAFDLGFQLSFMATIGLLLLSPYFTEKFKFLPVWLSIRGAVSATFAAIIFTLPLQIYNFGSFSLIAPVANVLVVPFIPLAMAFGFAAALGGLIFWPLGQIVGWFAWLPLTYEINVIKWLARFPTIDTKIPLWLFLLLYGVIIVVVWKINKNKKFKAQMSNKIQKPNDKTNLKFEF